jgi:FtsP/CotA-like multicopper oxidase with cupredoxin domain
LDPVRATERARADAVPRFALPLKIPPDLIPTARKSDRDEYTIVQREAAQEILPGRVTKIWGYEGMFPGPTIRVRRNRLTVVRHTNQLSTPTAVHLHGGINPPDSDGFAADVVTPGASRVYSYPNRQRAATLWYHDHAMDKTGENICHGLAGFYLVEDDEEQALPLPRGPFEVPLLVQDRAFNTDGSLAYDTARHMGFEGDVMLVNGVPWPKMDVSTRKYRFRLLNGCNARLLQLALNGADPFTLIGTDGGLLPAPVTITNLPLAMAERADVIVDFSRYATGTQIFLTNTREKPPLAPIMRFDVVRREADDVPVPSRLSDPGFLERPKASTTRTWSFRATFSFHDLPTPIVWTINGQRFDPNRSDAAVTLDSVELWRFRNEAPLRFLGSPHPTHVHLAHFQILERNGKPPLVHERGWKDTVALDIGEDVLVMLRCEQFRGRYMLHCHNLEHEDRAMMTRFDVT